MPVYLDENGEPIAQGTVYLDENGEPIQSAAPAEPPPQATGRAAALDQRLEQKYPGVVEKLQNTEVLGMMPGPPLQAIKAVPGVIAKGLGISKARAGANMQSAIEAAKSVPVNPRESGNIALRMFESKGYETVPQPVQTFLRRLTAPGEKPFLVPEAQTAVSSMSAHSADALRKMSPQMRRQMTQLAKALRGEITEAAETVGKGAQYAKGVREFRRANVVGKATKRTAQAAGIGVGTDYVLRRLSDALKGAASGSR
ncbi:MAG TPA: hypothetical protein VEA69_01405 [Tepidisphaeraceae bacterium]|nr:hypothetical protein [Tepidisphaeraceae bacterium]